MIVHTGPHYIKQRLFGFEAFYNSMQSIGTFPTFTQAKQALENFNQQNRSTPNVQQ
jgi:hypothetical protein